MSDNAVWLSARDAARYIGRAAPTAYKTILRKARQGEIRAGRDGKTFVFKPEDLDAWLYLKAKEVVR